MNPAAEFTLSVVWFGFVFALAFWARFDVPIWGAF